MVLQMGLGFNGGKGEAGSWPGQLQVKDNNAPLTPQKNWIGIHIC
jgi:hypothetical protein